MPSTLKAWSRCARRWLAIAAFLLSAVLAWPATQAQAAGDLAPLLEKIRSTHDVPALAAIIVDGTRISALGVTGQRRMGEPTPVDLDDRWHLGAVGKPLTATLAARLVDRGIVTFDTTLEDAFGVLVPEMHAAYKSVTLSDLLAHRSGLASELTKLPIWNADLWLGAEPAHEARLRVTRALLAQSPETRPGHTFNYSDAGYIVAGVMLERMAGEPFEALLTKEVMVPLGMHKTGFGAPGEATKAQPPREPWGHHDGPGGRIPIEPDVAGDNPPAFAPAGTMHASLRDMASFLAAHLAGARGQGWLLKQESFDHLYTAPAGQEYALGWVTAINPGAGGLALSHAGTNLNWYAVAWLFPGWNIAVFVATNQGGPSGFAAIEEAVAEAVTFAKERIPGVGN